MDQTKQSELIRAALENVSTLSDIVVKTESTTFCNSASSEPLSILSFTKLPILETAFVAKFAKMLPTAIDIDPNAFVVSFCMPFTCFLKPLLLTFKSNDILPTDDNA